MDATAAALPVLVQDKGNTTRPRGPPLAWRLGVSLAAVALTWATSLRVAISVAGAFVVVPSASLVRDTCETLRDATTHAEAVYVECVDAQSSQCDRHYDDVLLDVDKTLRDKQKRNEASLQKYREIYETCASNANALMGRATYRNASFKAPSTSFEATLPSSSWTASCKDASKLTGADVLEAQAAQSEDAAAFATESASMVNAMSLYAEDRARYDATYIRDVYESVEAASSHFKLPSNTTWPGVATALGDIRACLSIDANVSCKIQPDARDAFGTYASKVRLQVAMASDVVTAYTEEAHAYQQRVEDAFATMSAFYDAFHTWYARLNVIEIDPPGALFDVGREDFYAYPWLHATVLRLGAAFAIFLVLQLSRSWIVDGLCRLNWRRLTDAAFAYEASCDIDGNALVEGDFRAHVRADLKRRLRAWLWVGRLKVMGAVLVHAAWVAPLARLRRDLAYAPH